MNIFEQDNYKVILKHLVIEKRKSLKGFSAKLSQYLGVHPTLVSQVLAGTKDFTEEQMLSVCEFIGVPKLESQYLLVLLQKERAGSKKLKDYFQELKEQLRKQSSQVKNRVRNDRQLTEVERAVFYSSWIYSAVHLVTTLEQQVRFEDICTKLNITPAKAREVLDFLIKIQMVIESEGLFTTGTRATHLDKNSPFLVKHHTNWRLKAIQAAEKLSDQELMYTANFSVSKKDFNSLREELLQVIQRFNVMVGPSPAEDIAQFNLDLFWI